MTETLRLVRVFVASPGDLSEERRAIKELEDELNIGIASYLGFRIEIGGWEDTLSGSGRPQSIINQEVERCELFIGMMSRKWGTPPAQNGKYTSGFEEELALSTDRYKRTGKPEIAMYFKKIPTEFLEDQGDDLKKVLAFKARVISERSILFEEFEGAYALQKRVRLKIQRYLVELKKAEEENNDEQLSKSKIASIEGPSISKGKKQDSGLFSKEANDFIKEFVKKTETYANVEQISPIEIARIRLLSNSITKPGNDQPRIGVHDANIIFSHRCLEWSYREISKLADLGLENIKYENVPLWHWLRLCEGSHKASFLAYRSVSSYKNVKSGALEAMKLIGTPLPSVEKDINRSFFINSWLSESSSDSVKISALQYLKHHGKEEDLQLIKSELGRDDPKTSRVALEAIISIELYYKASEALKTAIENQFEFFDHHLIERLLNASSEIDEKTLHIGLTHKNKIIRLESFRRLKKTNSLKPEQLKELKSDPSAALRKEAVDYLTSTEQSLNDDEVKSILIRSTKNIGLRGLLGASSAQYDEDGQACYEEYLFSKYYSMPESDLASLVKEGSILDNTPYFALCSRYFKKYSEELRKDIDEKFKGKFEDYIKSLKSIGAPEDLLNKSMDIEAFVRKKATRRALDILCMKGEKKDLSRVRDNMRSEYVKSSYEEIEYLRKNGTWEDIEFLLKAEKEFFTAPPSLLSPSDKRWDYTLAEALYSIGRDRIDEVLNMEIPSNILIELTKLCALSKFLEISKATLIKLLNDKDDMVRKFVTLKCIQAYSKKRLRTILEEYLNNQDYKYYNVIFWLDLGITMPKPVIRNAIDIINTSS